MRGEEEQVNVVGRSGGRVDKGKTGHRERLLLGCTLLGFKACKSQIRNFERVVVFFRLFVVCSVWVISGMSEENITWSESHVVLG